MTKGANYIQDKMNSRDINIKKQQKKNEDKE